MTETPRLTRRFFARVIASTAQAALRLFCARLVVSLLLATLLVVIDRIARAVAAG